MYCASLIHCQIERNSQPNWVTEDLLCHCLCVFLSDCLSLYNVCLWLFLLYVSVSQSVCLSSHDSLNFCSFHMTYCLFLSLSLSVCLLSVCLADCPAFHLTCCLSVWLSTVCLPHCLSVYLADCLSCCLPVCLVQDDYYRSTMVSFKMGSLRATKRIWKVCVEHHSFFR